MTEPEPASLELTGVDVDIAGRAILKDICLTASPGTIVGVIGPNGSGKTTLLRSVYRSLRPRRGAVLVDGRDLSTMSAREAARTTAAVVQDGFGAPEMTVREAVVLGRTAHHGIFGRDTAVDVRAVEEAMDRTSVTGFADRSLGSLSGGERQRVVLARALAQRPRLLVLDEITNHLDVRARFEVVALVRSLGLTTVAVLHELDLAVRWCDTVVVLDRGRVVSAGAVPDAVTPMVLREVFGVVASVERGEDGVLRVVYAADPLV